jgi:hypothetical protein
LGWFPKREIPKQKRKNFTQAYNTLIGHYFSHDESKNVAVMATKLGIKNFSAFAVTVEEQEPFVCCFTATGAPAPPQGPHQSPTMKRAKTTPSA